MTCYPGATVICYLLFGDCHVLTLTLVMQVLLCLLSLSFIVLSFTFTFTLSFTCYPGATVPTAGEAGGPRILE